MTSKEIQIFNKGIHNLLDDEIIPESALSRAQNWLTQDGRLILSYGRDYVGGEGTAGKIYGQIFGYRPDGTTVHWRKAGTEIQYLNGSTWTTVITGLTENADYAFTNYSSLAGAFTFAFGIDGIYKMNNANPASYISLYNSAKNFKGKAFIDKGRTILWDRKEDKTGLYGSFIDRQDSTVYTTVAGEVIAGPSGTLAFKSGNPTANAFGVVITIGAETFTDNYNGLLVGSLGGTGTINYITGAFTTSVSGAGTANYQWEDSNNKGVTDFTHATPRVAGEGFQFPQDEGGDAILNVLIGADGYYSMKSKSTYRLLIGDDDTTADNNVYRIQLGLPSYRAAVSTGKGIVFMNTANPEKPEMTILQKNLTGDAFEPVILFNQFKFADYNYDDCTFGTYGRYIIVACKPHDAVENIVTLLCNVEEDTVSVTDVDLRTSAQDAGNLYAGSPFTTSIYKLYNGFDDLGNPLENFAETKGETWESNFLKKERKIRLKGRIAREQSYEVYIDFDSVGYQLIGTVLGTADYVDYSSPAAIGGSLIGTETIGGGDSSDIYPYFMEIRLKKVPKFRKRKLKFVALGIGYLDIDMIYDWDISTYQDKLPVPYRQKQNVSLSGQSVNLPHPEF